MRLFLYYTPQQSAPITQLIWLHLFRNWDSVFVAYVIVRYFLGLKVFLQFTRRLYSFQNLFIYKFRLASFYDSFHCKVIVLIRKKLYI